MKETTRNTLNHIGKITEAIKANSKLYEALQICHEASEIKQLYISGGCIAQAYWNYKTNKDPMHGIEDFDIAYFDRDTSYEAEDKVIRKLGNSLKHLGIKVDIKNQARVHLWYGDKYGVPIKPYVSTKDAIDTYPTTASAIGIRRTSEENFCIYAPFGLEDVVDFTVRPNKIKVTSAYYDDKATKWKSLWPELKIIPW
jgi:hypothetical protein